MKRNKTILITGGAVRLGRSLAISLAKNGYDLIIHYNKSKNEAKKLEQLLRRYNVRCHLLQADLTQKETSNELIENAFSIAENLYGIINNASIFVKMRPYETSYENLSNIFALNCFVPIMLTRLFAERTTKEGVAINMLDSRIVKNDTDAFSYTLSKKALAEATKMLAKEFAPKVRVNAIAPGPVIAPNFKRTGVREKAGVLPLMKKPTVQDIAKGVLFLLETKSISGQIIFIDSGQHLIK